MSEVQQIKSFLESITYEEKRCSCLNWKTGQNPFVTISRQAGAGGNSLANAILAELLGNNHEGPLFQNWRRFNEELCRRIAEEPGLSVSLDTLIKYEYRSQIEDMLDELIAGNSPQDLVTKKMFHLMRTLATFGKVILVGRGGVCLTRELPLGIHVRLVAPLNVRIKRMRELFSLNEKKAKELVLEQDKGRAMLIKTFFNKDIDDPLLYDVIWNTDTVCVEDIARSIVSLIKAKACHCAVVETRK